MFGESIRVLIVDGKLERDDHVEATLVSAGFATWVVNDSVSASGVLEVWNPSVAVVDLRSPGSEGRRFCADLAARSAANALPVVLIAEGPNLLKWLPVIPAALVATPIDAEHLIAAVTRVARAVVDAGSTTLARR